MAGPTTPAGKPAGKPDPDPTTTPTTPPDPTQLPGGDEDRPDPEPMRRDATDPQAWTGEGDPPEPAYMPNVTDAQAAAVREEVNKLEGVAGKDRDEAVKRGLARGAKSDEAAAKAADKARKAAAGEQETSAAPRVAGPAGSDPATTTPDARTT